MRFILFACAVSAAACGASENVPARTATTSSTVAGPTPDAPTLPAPAPDLAPAPPAPVSVAHTTTTPSRPPTVAAPPPPAAAYAVTTPASSLQTSTMTESPSLPAARVELTRDDGHGGMTPADQGKSGSELRITAAVRRAVVRDDTLSLGAKNVKIITTGTRVTLRGDVSSVYERDRVETQARTADGVTAVDNQLEVK